jgi:hypothetical protein
MTTNRTTSLIARHKIAATWTWAVLALAGACRSGDKGPPAAAQPGSTPPSAAANPATPPVAAGPASVGREITVQSHGKPWVQIVARGQTLTVVTEGESLAGQPRDDGKRKYAPAQGGSTVIEVKPRAAGDGEPGDIAAGFKLRGPDGKLLWKVKAGATKIKVAAEEEDVQGGRQPFVISAKHPGDVAVLAPDGLGIGRVRAVAGSTDVTGEDAAGAEVFRTSTDLPPAFLGVLLLQGMPLRERAIILAELAARMTTR